MVTSAIRPIKSTVIEASLADKQALLDTLHVYIEQGAIAIYDFDSATELLEALQNKLTVD